MNIAALDPRGKLQNEWNFIAWESLSSTHRGQRPYLNSFGNNSKRAGLRWFMHAVNPPLCFSATSLYS